MHKNVRIVIAALWLCAAPLAARADQKDPRLDGLFSRLHDTKDADEAQALENLIWSIWTESGKPAIDKEMSDGIAKMQLGDGPAALKVFEQMVGEAPDFAEAWNKRATLYYYLGRYEESIQDVKKTLALEPRHFGALAGLGMIYLETGRPAQAIEWMEKALAVNPHLWVLERKLEQLRSQERGRPI